MSKKSLAILLILLLTLGAGWLLLRETETKDIVTGTMEVTTYDVTAKVPGYIRNFTLREGDTVQAGDKVCDIERNDLEAQVMAAQAALMQARAALADAESGSRSQEINMAKSRVRSAESMERQAAEDYRRFESLAAQDAISRQQLDAAQARYEVAEQELKSAREALSLAQEGSRPERIEAHRADVARMEAMLESSYSMVEDTEVRAPADGLVLSKNFENNEFLPAGVPILTIADMKDCWLRVYLPTEELPNIKVGQKVQVLVDGLDGPREGYITEIAEQAEYTPRQSITKRERANLVFRVKIRVDNEDGTMKPGMPADVVFE